MVVERVSSDLLRVAVSVPLVLEVNSLTASVREYGAPVRDNGMTSEVRSVPWPLDSRVRIRCPSSVPMRMWAVVSEPSRTFPLTRNVTSALPSYSSTPDTVPTVTPETLTSFPDATPPASVNSA